MARVFIVQDDGRKNFGPALTHGEPVVLAAYDLTPWHDSTPVLHEMQRRLATFGDDDRLLCTGDPLLIGAATVYAARANNGRVPCLKWDKQDKVYYEVVLRLY